MTNVTAVRFHSHVNHKDQEKNIFSSTVKI
jgi:hypothetical protein